MKLRVFAVLAVTLCLTGCAVNPPSTLLYSPTPGNTGVTGNWEITLTSTNHSPAAYPFGIYLAQSGSTVSGVASWAHDAFPQCIVNGIPCGFPFEVLNPSLTGTVSGNTNLVLTSAISTPYPGSLFLNADVATDGTMSGTYSITYGTYVDQGNVSGDMIEALNGTYSGTVTSSTTGLSMGITTTLSQAAPPASGGFLPFSGSASFTGSKCIPSAALPASGSFLGDQIEISLSTATSPTSTILLSGTLSPDAKTLAVTYGVTGTCGDDGGSGTLTRQ